MSRFAMFPFPLATQTAMDKTDDDRTAMSGLLAYLNKIEIISDGQAKKGFDRLHEASISYVLE